MTYFNLYEWRNRTGISPYSAAEKLGILKITYWIYEFFSECPKSVKVACIYIELSYIAAREHSNQLKINFPYRRYHRMSEGILINGLIEGFNPFDELVTINLKPKQHIHFVGDR